MFLFVSLSDSSEAFCSQAYSLIFMPQLHALWCSKIRGKMSITCGNSGNYLMKYINWSKKIPSDNNWGQSVKRRVVRKVKEITVEVQVTVQGLYQYAVYASWTMLTCVTPDWSLSTVSYSFDRAGWRESPRQEVKECVSIYVCVRVFVCLACISVAETEEEKTAGRTGDSRDTRKVHRFWTGVRMNMCDSEPSEKNKEKRERMSGGDTETRQQKDSKWQKKFPRTGGQ